MPANKRVLLVGWDAADWKVIMPLVEQGKMPAVKRLVESGVSGSLSTIYPVLSPMLWTSIATGKRPFRHGVLGFTEPLPDCSGIRPVTNLQRRTKALWNILGQEGLRSSVVGWWPSHPAEPIRGVMVSNQYQRASGPLAEGWPLQPGTVHPRRLETVLADLRFHPDEMVPEMVLPFIPRAAEIDQEKDPRLATFMNVFSDCTTIQSAATWLMENEPWDFMAVYFDAIDHFSHAFMRYHPPRRPFIPERDYELFSGVVEGAYRYHDMMLARLVELAGEDTVVVLISDHGFHPDHLRPRTIPSEPAGPAVEHREHGILAAAGPGLRRDELVHGASILDIAPTVLNLFGLPHGLDMDGRSLFEDVTGNPGPDPIDSWDARDGDAGLHPPGMELDAGQAGAALRQLEALGYIEPVGPSTELNVLRTQRELDYNLARSYADAGMQGEARPLLEKLYRDFPEEYRFGIQLALCYQALGYIPELRALVDAMNLRRARDADAASKELEVLRGEALQRRAAAGRPDEDGPLFTRELFNEAELRRIRHLRGMAVINRFALDYLEGCVLAGEGRFTEALSKLSDAEKLEPERPGLLVYIGEVYLRLGRLDDAGKVYSRALAVDPACAAARLGLGRILLRQGRPFEALAEIRVSLGLQYHQPLAHYLAGLACMRLGRADEAQEHLARALDANPNFIEAHLRLAALARRRADREQETSHLEAARSLREHRREAERRSIDVPLPPEQGGGRAEELAAKIRDARAEQDGRYAYNGEPITVVSGLPRSGTSMVMQMLKAGGLEPAADGLRGADESNPRGYLEDERVKRLREDAAWLKGEGGRAVKVIAQQLPYLYPGLQYRVVFMVRDSAEVAASQAAMLNRLDRAAASSPTALQAVFERQAAEVRGMLDRSRIPVLYLDYAETVADPAVAAAALNRFLGGNLDEASMAAAVDPVLYRQKR